MKLVPSKWQPTFLMVVSIRRYIIGHVKIWAKFTLNFVCQKGEGEWGGGAGGCKLIARPFNRPILFPLENKTFMPLKISSNVKMIFDSYIHSRELKTLQLKL